MYAGWTFSSVSTAPGVSPGGTFTRTNLVAFNPSTGAITGFAPNINGEVWALATDGTSLYVGGTFTAVNGVARRGLAKLNPTTGAVDPMFNANFSSGRSPTPPWSVVGCSWAAPSPANCGRST